VNDGCHPEAHDDPQSGGGDDDVAPTTTRPVDYGTEQRCDYRKRGDRQDQRQRHPAARRGGADAEEERAGQRDAPDAAQGRAFARFESQFQLAWVAGALLPVAVRVPQNVGFFVLAIGLGLAAMTYATGRRTLRPRSTSTNTGAAKSPFGD
jgi:hypothetical protein